MFTRALYDSINQVEIIFSPKVVLLPSNRKINPEIQRPLILGICDTAIKILSRLILTRTFQNLPNEFRSISGSEKIASPCFQAISFVYK